jgi:hypothetical protein
MLALAGFDQARYKTWLSPALLLSVLLSAAFSVDQAQT